MLKRLCEKGLVDYVAMDIKACEERYPAVAGVSSLQMENIRESIEFLKSGAVPYEFRTTVVRELHSAEDFQKIGPWIAGAPLYFLQNFSDSGSVLNPIYTSCTVPELTSYLEIVNPLWDMQSSAASTTRHPASLILWSQSLLPHPDIRIPVSKAAVVGRLLF